jgi:hypothetical protein
MGKAGAMKDDITNPGVAPSMTPPGLKVSHVLIARNDPVVCLHFSRQW